MNTFALRSLVTQSTIHWLLAGATMSSWSLGRCVCVCVLCVYLKIYFLCVNVFWLAATHRCFTDSYSCDLYLHAKPLQSANQHRHNRRHLQSSLPGQLIINRSLAHAKNRINITNLCSDH